jgi:hypothetical protein
MRLLKNFPTLLLVLATCGASLSQASLPEIASRSIMDSCGFLYRVESDVRLQLPSGLMEIYDPESLVWDVYFTNSWKREPARSELLEWIPDAQGLVETSFESMSNAKGYLYRQIFFRVLVKGVDGAKVPLTPLFEADIGRRFGEACYSGRSSGAPFVNREVRVLPDEPSSNASAY